MKIFLIIIAFLLFLTVIPFRLHCFFSDSGNRIIVSFFGIRFYNSKRNANKDSEDNEDDSDDEKKSDSIKKEKQAEKKRKIPINQTKTSIKRKKRKIITIKHLMMKMMAFFQNFLICCLKNLKY